MDIDRFIKTNNEHKILAADQALSKKAPFHKQKNSMGDAILFFSCMEFLKGINNSELYFITDNSKDFSSQDISQIHADLLTIAREYGVKIHYSLNPEETLNQIIDRVTIKFI